MRVIVALLATALAVGLVAACGQSGPTERLTIFAASSLTDVFREAASAFEQTHPGVEVTMHLAGSSTLRVQLEQGAAADLFASANEQQMKLAQQAGLTERGPVIFATNRLAIVTKTGDATIQGLADLARPGVRLAMAAPQVPIGAHAETALGRIAADPEYGPDFAERVRANAVTEALNVRQAVAAVQLGVADAALAYATDAYSAKGLVAVPLPDRFNVVATFPIAVVRGARAEELARAFVTMLRSRQGRAILERYGFETTP